jgi:hypothetical protein
MNKGKSRKPMMNEIEIIKKKHFKLVLNLLFEATPRIQSHYFQLPVAGLEDPIYRERVYCYELYHCIRECMPYDCPYVLGGEVDKMRHPIIYPEIGSAKPDFIIHIPGEMGLNLVVMEVKPINAIIRNIRKDIETLCLFTKFANYPKAILFVYGEEDEDNKLKKFERVIGKHIEEFSADSLYLIFHSRAGQKAEIIFSN